MANASKIGPRNGQLKQNAPMKIRDVCTDCGAPLSEHTCPGKVEADPVAVAYAVQAANQVRDAAIEELNKTKAAIDWTMGKLLVKDLFRIRGSEEMPVAAPDFLPGFDSDPADTERIDFINKHGRVSVGQHGQFCFVLDTGLHLGSEQGNAELDAQFPDIYNFRHFVDVCRKSKEPKSIVDRLEDERHEECMEMIAERQKALEEAETIKQTK
jgi:hypothetical protein